MENNKVERRDRMWWGPGIDLKQDGQGKPSLRRWYGNKDTKDLRSEPCGHLGRAFQIGAKAHRQEQSESASGTTKRPVWLQQNLRGGKEKGKRPKSCAGNCMDLVGHARLLILCWMEVSGGTRRGIKMRSQGHKSQSGQIGQKAIRATQ